MFRRLSSSLPKDPVFPADLEALGYVYVLSKGINTLLISLLSYFVNEKDQIRAIENPDQEFNYFISKNERVNDLQREAFNSLWLFPPPRYRLADASSKVAFAKTSRPACSRLVSM